LKENRVSSEYEVITGKEANYEVGLLRLSTDEGSSAIIWSIDKLKGKSKVKILYDIRSGEGEDIMEERKREDGVIVTPYKVSVEAIDEWDEEISAPTAKATYRESTDAEREDQDSGSRGGPPGVRRQ